MALLSIANLYREDNGIVTVQHFNLHQQVKEKIAIAGETGSGKTSVLKMIAGLMQPTSGQILLQGQKVLGPDEKLLPGHPQIAYLSQYFELRNNYKVIEWLEMANQLSVSDATTIYRICEIDHLLQRKTDQLSGGEKQRIALARLLTTSPQLLLLDEPFSNLDALHKKTIKTVIKNIGDQLQITCIMVSHDATDMLAWADTIIIMKEGEIIQQGSPKQVYLQPNNEYCAALFGDYNLLENETAAAFGLSMDNANKYCIRPHQILISSKSDNAVQATVEQVDFCGAYCKLIVATAFQPLLVTTDACNYQKDNIVYLQLPQQTYWAC
jgi:iron(III) transport system ATP-binding protein